MIDILDAHIIIAGKDLMGQVSGGSTRVKGRLHETRRKLGGSRRKANFCKKGSYQIGRETGASCGLQDLASIRHLRTWLGPCSTTG